MPHEQERREFVRIKSEVLVKYKFLSATKDDPVLDNIYQGYTSNISGGGVLLKGELPKFDWMPDLLMKKIVIGINLFLPTEEEPIQALTRVAWVEAVEEKTRICVMGLKFKEITREDRDKIFKFIVRSQMKS